MTAYIDRYGLYRGRVPSRVTRLDLSEPRWQIVADERNPKAMHLADRLRRMSGAATSADVETPNAVLAIGGDGTMLRAIRQHWQKRVPFFGVNAGHLGFLLNDADTVLATPGVQPRTHHPPDAAALRGNATHARRPVDERPRVQRRLDRTFQFPVGVDRGERRRTGAPGENGV